MLKEEPCGDCLLHCFCEACALCQEYRELKNRGYNMSVGNFTYFSHHFFSYLFIYLFADFFPYLLIELIRMAWKCGETQ